MHGAELFGRLGCAACHAADVAVVRGPTLTDAGSTLRPAWLRAALEHHEPDPFPRLTAAERASAIDALWHFTSARGAAPAPRGVRGAPLWPRELERGRALYHSVGCVACHAPLETVDDLEEPLWSFAAGWDSRAGEALRLPSNGLSLAGVAERRTVGALQRFLTAAPTEPGDHPSLWLSSEEARAIAQYLATPEVHAGRLALEERSGFAYAYFEGGLDDELASYLGPPVREGLAADLSDLPAHREERCGFRFEGFVDIAVTGRYEFTLTSDDGSRLWIDGELVVDNGGDHAPATVTSSIEVTAGRHLVVVTYYENGGGQELSVTWRGPGLAERTLGAPDVVHWVSPLRAEPPVLDFARIARGGQVFDALACGACHPLDDRGVIPTAGAPAGPAAAHSDPWAAASCLGPNGVLAYDLADDERAALVAFLERPGAEEVPADSAGADGAPEGTWPDADLDRRLTRLGCLACHQRGGVGGPTPEIAGYFRETVEVDLGNEGRLPPRLTGVGAKLRPDALEHILVPVRSGAVPDEVDDLDPVAQEPLAPARRGAVRPYLATRMPRFAPADVASLSAALRRVDGAAFRTAREPLELLPDTQQIEDGRRLAGTGGGTGGAGTSGLGCIQCHVFADFGSTGIPAVDLTRMAERLESSWFRELLLDPKSVGMNSRMAEFWIDGRSPIRDVLEGDPERQVEALWSYLSLKSAMPLPAGLAVAGDEYELVPTGRPRIVGAFLENVGPRCVAVGFPERLHYAFDVGSSRLAYAWRGRFFDARGTWYGRAGVLEVPPSDDVLTFPEGPAFARLADLDEPWPTASGRELGLRPLGRRLDPAGVPTFRYAFGPDTLVDDRSTPLLDVNGARLVRALTVTTGSGEGLALRLGVARSIERATDSAGERWWLDDRLVEVREELGRPLDLRVRRPRTNSGLSELVLALAPLAPLTSGASDTWHLSISYSW